MDTTIDGILNQRVQIEQPAQGYRIAIDTVFLAAAVPAKAGQRVADFGCGVGGAMLVLAARVPGIGITGIDIQDGLVELCRKNIARNNMRGLEVRLGDVTQFSGGGFDHIMMNPPYHDEARHDVSADAMKRTANAEKDGGLLLWIAASAKALKPDGVLALIHRADRTDEILKHAAQDFGAIEMVPLLPKADAAPKRVVMRLYKKGQGITRCSPVVLCKPGGGYTDAADAVLRHAKVLEFA